MSATTLRPEPQAPLSHLAGDELVTVVTVDRETPWQPRSPLDVPPKPRQAGGMSVRRMPLAEMIKQNQQAMRTQGRFWYLAAEDPDCTAAKGEGVPRQTEAGGELLTPRQIPMTAAPNRPAEPPTKAMSDRASRAPGRIAGTGATRATSVISIPADTADPSAGGSNPDEGDDTAGILEDRDEWVPPSTRRPRSLPSSTLATWLRLRSCPNTTPQPSPGASASSAPVPSRRFGRITRSVWWQRLSSDIAERSEKGGAA